MIADGADVFVLLVFYYLTCELASPMYIVPPARERASTDIAETTARIKDVAGDLTSYSCPQWVRCGGGNLHMCNVAAHQNSPKHVMLWNAP